jgi:hypothetical protein
VLCDWSELYVFVARRVRDRKPCVGGGGAGIGREEKSKMDGSVGGPCVVFIEGAGPAGLGSKGLKSLRHKNRTRT